MANTSIRDKLFAAVSNDSVSQLQKMIDVDGWTEVYDTARLFNEEGETAILLAIRRRHLGVVKFLVDEAKVDLDQNGRFQWKGTDHSAVPPLFAAVVSGQPAIVEFLICTENADDGISVDIMGSILTSSITRAEKIDALELVGSAYISRGRIAGQRLGVPCWMQATILRQPRTGVRPEIPKSIHPSSDVRKAVGDTLEFSTLEELVTLLTREEYHQFLTHAILVSHRILTRLNAGPNFFLFSLLLSYTRYNDARRDPGRVINILKLISEPIQHHVWEEDESYYSERNTTINSTISRLCDIFRMLRRETPDINTEELTFTNVMMAVELALHFHQTRTSDSDEIESMSQICSMDIISLVVMLLEMQLTQQESRLFRQKISHLISLDHRNSDNRNLLHNVTCCFQIVPTNVLQLFLELGADPNATDREGNTPLHLLAENKWERSRTDAARMLLDFGGHLDHANRSGITALDRLKKRMQSLVRRGNPDSNLESIIQTVLSLSCHCAKVLLQHQMDIQVLPPKLQRFVSKH